MNGLYVLKLWYTRRLGSIVDVAVARDVSPDVFSVLGVAGATIAGVALARGWWLLAAAGLAMRLAGANLDGAVASASGRVRPWGSSLTSSAIERRPAVWRLLVITAALAATVPTFVSLAAAAASARPRPGSLRICSR